MKLHTALAALSFVAVGAMTAEAQITTFIQPPRASAPPATAPGQPSAADSLVRGTTTDMRVWVDSVLGVPRPSATRPDTIPVATPVVATARPDSVPVRRDSITVVRGGVVAPDTATPMPRLVALGLLAMTAGLALRRRA